VAGCPGPGRDAIIYNGAGEVLISHDVGFMSREIGGADKPPRALLRMRWMVTTSAWRNSSSS